MHTVTSFHASAVEPEHLRAIMVEYAALERARIYRRLFVARFGLLAFFLAVVGFGFHWLSCVRVVDQRGRVRRRSDMGLVAE